MAVKGLTQAALAKELGLTEGRVSQLKAQGMPTHSVEAAQAWREAQQNVAARKPVPAAVERWPDAEHAGFGGAGGFGDLPDEDFQMARTRREIAEANLAEMREAELEGKLIRVDAIRAAWAKRVSSARDSLMQIPHRLAPVLAAESDIERVSRALDEELRQALNDLSRDGAANLGGHA
jgi:transcriptional regulator with XRE-family HTH domain